MNNHAADLARIRRLAASLNRELGIDLDVRVEDGRTFVSARDLDASSAEATLTALAGFRAAVDPDSGDLDLDLIFERDNFYFSARNRNGKVEVAAKMPFGGRKQVALDGSGAPVRVSSQASRLARAATLLLPPGERSRYGEEWAGELWGIAEGGGRRQAQMAYVMRVARGALIVRFELARPQRRKAP